MYQVEKKNQEILSLGKKYQWGLCYLSTEDQHEGQKRSKLCVSMNILNIMTHYDTAFG